MLVFKNKDLIDDFDIWISSKDMHYFLTVDFLQVNQLNLRFESTDRPRSLQRLHNVVCHLHSLNSLTVVPKQKGWVGVGPRTV